jgi:hypothetical protein
MVCGDSRGIRGDVLVLICDRQREKMHGAYFGGAVKPISEDRRRSVGDTAIRNNAEWYMTSERVFGKSAHGHGGNG